MARNLICNHSNINKKTVEKEKLQPSLDNSSADRLFNSSSCRIDNNSKLIVSDSKKSNSKTETACKKSSKDNNHSKTNGETTSDSDKDEESNNSKSDLRNILQSLKGELIQYRNENQILKREILVARSVVEREAGGNSETFEELEKKIYEEEWMGRREVILSLQKRLHELKNILQERGGTISPKIRRRKSPIDEDIPEERKSYWRLQLERQDVLRNARREQKCWVEERNRLKERLEPLLKRNEELSDQASILRFHLSLTPQDSTMATASRLREVERRLKYCLEDKYKLHKHLESEEALFRENQAAIENLKSEIDLADSSLRIAEENLTSLKSDDELLDQFEKEIQSDIMCCSSKFRKKLGEASENHMMKLECIKYMLSLMNFNGDSNLGQFGRERSVRPVDDGSLASSFSKDTFQEDVQSSLTEEEEADENVKSIAVTQIKQNSQESDLTTDLELRDENISIYDIAKLNGSFEMDQMKNYEMSQQMYDVISNTRRKIKELLESQADLKKVSERIKILRHKLCQLTNRHSVGKSDLGGNYDWSNENQEFLQDHKLILSGLRKENKFLKAIIESLFETKQNDFDICSEFLCVNKEFFFRNLPM